MASDEENYESDEEIDVKQHSRLLQDVFALDKKQSVKKPTRTEPSTQVSEFNLVKTSGKATTVNINDLTKCLEKKTKHGEVSKKVKSAQRKVSTLRAPLEKPQRDRIKRSVGFKEVTLDLEKWDPIVIKNRVSSQLHFPLNQGSLKIHKGKELPFQLRIKSKLDEELEKIDPVVVEKEEAPESFPLSLKEIYEKRREMARLRAQQSYQEAKYHRQNKIKSKKFHRIQRKERLKTQMKDFEKLQKNDPEAALKKLEEIDKTRAEERMSLRHRSTGQWAKNKLVRAKYDKEIRQELSQQLAISRDLTQKLRVDSSSESENEEIPVLKVSDQSNPWVDDVKREEEIVDFISGYRKYWDEKNKMESGSNDLEIVKERKHSEKKKRKCDVSEGNVDKNKVKNDVNLKRKLDSLDLSEFLAGKLKSKKPKRKNLIHSTTDWEVDSISEPQENIEEMFEELEDAFHDKVEEKVTDLKKNLQKRTLPAKPKNKRKPAKKKLKNSDYLQLPREKMVPEIDEELTMDDNVPVKSPVIKPHKMEDQKEGNIDPNKYINLKPTNLNTFLPDNVIIGDDNEDSDTENAQKGFITEAFAGDDIVMDFRKEKKTIIDKEGPQDVDLSLPGWGTWGGKNIKRPRRKKKRFIVKFPKILPRRDDNKGQLIINEKKNEALKKHLVTEVPFPFQSVKDFEGSIRAPIGDTFMPQSAFRRLIKPSVVTKKGAIIEPMTDDILVKHKFTRNGMVVKR